MAELWEMGSSKNTYHQVKRNCFEETISENADGCSRKEHDTLNKRITK